MAKKRRLLGSPSPCSSKMRYDGRGDDVMVARDRLKEALQEISTKSDDESSSSQEETPSKPTQVKKEVKAPLIRRRKRKMAVDLELAFHHTFVMKLFDRSVDLAQFKEDTPLYPICRAWIANQPRIPLPYPPVESPEIKKELESSSFDFDPEEIKDIEKLPAPSCGPWANRIPRVETPLLEGVTLDYSSEDLPTADELLKGHLSRWGNIRRNWIEAAQTNEARFTKSARILSNMYKRKVRLVKQVTPLALNDLRTDYKIEEQNMLYLRHPFLTLEQSKLLTAELKKEKVTELKKQVHERDAKYAKKSLRITDYLNHLKKSTNWDVIK